MLTPLGQILVAIAYVLVLCAAIGITAWVVAHMYKKSMEMLEDSNADLARRYHVVNEMVSLMDGRITACMVQVGRVTRALATRADGGTIDLEAMGSIEEEFGRQRQERMEHARATLDSPPRTLSGISREVAFNRAMADISRMRAAIGLDPQATGTLRNRTPRAETIGNEPPPRDELFPLPIPRSQPEVPADARTWYDHLREDENEPNR